MQGSVDSYVVPNRSVNEESEKRVRFNSIEGSFSFLFFFLQGAIVDVRCGRLNNRGTVPFDRIFDEKEWTFVFAENWCPIGNARLIEYRVFVGISDFSAYKDRNQCRS